ncbi:unnamed protein product [Ectocarpus sp. 8 AP-2014]
MTVFIKGNLFCSTTFVPLGGLCTDGNLKFIKCTHPHGALQTSSSGQYLCSVRHGRKEADHLRVFIHACSWEYIVFMYCWSGTVAGRSAPFRTSLSFRYSPTRAVKYPLAVVSI